MASVQARRSPFRKFLMWGFHTYMNILIGGTDIKDTQCGFKLFTRRTAGLLFPVQHIDRWAFDVELVFLAARHHCPAVVRDAGMPRLCWLWLAPLFDMLSFVFGAPSLQEVPVTWEEIDGSKLDVLSSTLQMARDILTIRLCYTLGIWSWRAPEATAAAASGSADVKAAAAATGETESLLSPDADAADASTGATSSGPRSATRRRRKD
jgi:hypothetical protein